MDQEDACTVEKQIACIENVKNIPAEAEASPPISPQKSEEPVQISEVGHDDFDKDGIGFEALKAKTTISSLPSAHKSKEPVEVLKVCHEQTGKNEVGFEINTTESKTPLPTSSQKPEEPVENLEVRHEQTRRDGVGFEIIIAEATAVPYAPKRLMQSGKQLSANEIKQKMSIAEGRRRCLMDVIREKAQKSNKQVELVVQRKDEKNLNFLNRLQHKSTMRAQECADRRSYYLRNNLGKLRSDAPIEQQTMKMQLKEDVMQTYKKEQKCDKKNNSKTEHGVSVSDHKREVINANDSCALPGPNEKSSCSEDPSDNVEKKSCDGETEETETSTERLVGDMKGDKGRSVY
ncbi:uncharacterized protein LOC119687694 [Teleopsis dalmanni]|uniref:uncharacterized protein LOC119687694 n=1 Tax=Teleopsis dalmanni TaxID=139649 RepID=UPI0018CEACFD|nr:uncharacterized protein LOC119687694 [Teleopsis dalmanni]XP_037958037.1 uncharacterized protein LOC119687694 [Teleopsis dalmanni]